ncbi:hypothetical protein N0V90_012919 [Kalmusia sp. IMI 367209]|nr:hypothetical protein N0V90_012919 [Kalmusia sp. IMI 367209]
MTERNSGVRNLRAMFENQTAAASPEPRGRSPAGSGTNDVNRPTSKVRASFVSVEPSGTPKELGTTKGVSINTPQAQRRESFSVSDDSGDVAVSELKKVVSDEKEERRKSVAVDETIPEQAVETRESSRAPPPIREAPETMPNLGSIMKGSDFPEPEATPVEQPTEEEPTVQPGEEQTAPVEKNESAAEPLVTEAPADNPDKVVSGAQEEASLKPADPTDEATVAGGGALPPPTEDLSHPTTTEAVPQTPKITESKAEASKTPTTNGRASTKKPAAISTARSPVRGASSARSPLPKSPGAARLPRTPTAPKPTAAVAPSKSPAPAKAQPKPTAAKETTKAPTSKTTRAPVKPSSATAGTTASAAAKAKAPAAETRKSTATSTTSTATKTASSAPSSKESTTTSPGGFKKPRPRSPTRPVRLPSHLTAPTASSAAKHGEEAASQKLVRKPSTATKPPQKAAAPAAKKQPSRASLAPSTASARRPESRASTKGGAEEGFLARMMRPTASSASKLHDKPASPPRRGTTAKAPTKPKGPEGLAAKTKKKVEEVAHKTKDAVTNGHHDEKHDTAEPTTTEPAAESSVDVEAAPTEPADSATAVEESVHDVSAAEPSEPTIVESEASNLESQAVH